MKCRFVQAQKASWPVTVLCQTLGLKRGTYYAWSGRPTCRRQRDEQVLVLAIKAAFEEGRGTYGSPRVHAALVADGHRVGLNRVSRLMRENGLRVRPRRALSVIALFDGASITLFDGQSGAAPTA